LLWFSIYYISPYYASHDLHVLGFGNNFTEVYFSHSLHNPPPNIDLITLVMISTDCTDSKSNYYTTRLLVCLRNVWRYQKGSLEDVNRPLQSPKNDKRTNNDSPNITQKTKDREKWNPLKTGDELGCSRMINSFWSRCGTCLVTICPYYSQLCIQKIMQLNKSKYLILIHWDSV
jgi:hypothetical protein